LGISSIACSSGGLIVESFGSPTTYGVGDESDQDGEDDKTNDGKDTGDSSFVGEEPIAGM
jgi:hypothetical protein